MPRFRANDQATASNRHWTSERARGLLEEWEHTPVSLAEFARARGIAPRRLYWWRRQLGTAATAAAIDAPVFKEVVLARRSGERAEGAFEIVLPCGRIVRVGPVFDSDALRRVLEIAAEKDRAC